MYFYDDDLQQGCTYDLYNGGARVVLVLLCCNEGATGARGGNRGAGRPAGRFITVEINILNCW